MLELFGQVSRTDPIEAATLETMARASGGQGCDGTWIREGAALGRTVLRAATRTALPVPLPEWEGGVLVARARLDNREELAQGLGVPLPELALTPDEDLVLAALRRWGGDAPSHLAGDWCCAHWDPVSRTLLLARDAWGHTGVYYHASASGFAFATHPGALLALPDVPRRPNLQVAADRVLSGDSAGTETFHQGVAFLPAGHLLRWREGRIEIHRFWDPAALPPLHLPRDEDYVEAFLEVYGRAIRTRLLGEGPVGATLSAGLDSGSVVALAAPALARQGRELIAFTAVPAHPPSGADSRRTGDEWPLASATAGMAQARGGRIQHLPLPCRDASLLDSIARNYDIHLDPGQSVSNFFWIQGIMEQCRSRGLETLLTGQSGNGSISWTGTGSLFRPMLRGDFQGIAAALGAQANPWLALKRQILGPIVAQARRAWVLERMREPPGTRHPPGLRGPDRLALFTRRKGQLGAIWRQTSHHYGVEVLDPTRDLRLVEFCLRVPDDQYLRRGEYRWLLRRAMAGLMPAAVLDNRHKGLQSSDIGYRVLAERAGIQEALTRLEASSQVRDLLDLPRMRGVLRALEEGVTPATSEACNSVLLRGLSVGLALLRF